MINDFASKSGTLAFAEIGWHLAIFVYVKVVWEPFRYQYG